VTSRLFCPNHSPILTFYLALSTILSKSSFHSDILPCPLDYSVQIILPFGHFTLSSRLFCPNHPSIRTFYPVLSTILSESSSHSDILPCPLDYSVQIILSFGYFTLSSRLFCPNHPSIRTFYPVLSTILSKSSSHSDILPCPLDCSVRIILPFGHFTLSSRLFCPNHPPIRTFYPVLSTILSESSSHSDILPCPLDYSDQIILPFGHFTLTSRLFCPNHPSIRTFYPVLSTILSKSSFHLDILPCPLDYSVQIILPFGHFTLSSRLFCPNHPLIETSSLLPRLFCRNRFLNALRYTQKNLTNY